MDQRSFPHAVEAERMLLGGLIRDPEALPTIEERLEKTHFYRQEHAALYALLRRMNSRGEPIDVVSVPDMVAREGEPHRYGGIDYVIDLPDQVPSTANLPHWAGIILEKYQLRQLIEVTQSLQDRAYAQPEDVDDLLQEAGKALTQVGLGQKREAWQAISTAVDEQIMKIQEVANEGGGVPGTSCGFSELDKRLAGLNATDLLILAARPGMGKTALALNIATNVALMAKKAVGIFSLEMGRGQLVNRMLCCEAEVDSGKVRTGTLDQTDWERLVDAARLLRQAKIRISDAAGLTIGDVMSRSRRLKAEEPELGLVVIDYLQLMRADERGVPREQQISAISRGLKALAKELDIPVLALSQLNRGVESRADKRPLVSDLRESGAIEQDADVIMFIYRDDYYNEDSADPGVAEVIIAKQRNGPTGTVKLAFAGQFTRFDDMGSTLLRG